MPSQILKIFHHSALGDTQALNAQQLERTKTAIVPFPTDLEMVIRCSESLKMAIRGAIQNNRRYILIRNLVLT